MTFIERKRQKWLAFLLVSSSSDQAPVSSGICMIACASLIGLSLLRKFFKRNQEHFFSKLINTSRDLCINQFANRVIRLLLRYNLSFRQDLQNDSIAGPLQNYRYYVKQSCLVLGISSSPWTVLEFRLVLRPCCYILGTWLSVANVLLTEYWSGYIPWSEWKSRHKQKSQKQKKQQQKYIVVRNGKFPSNIIVLQQLT